MLNNVSFPSRTAVTLSAYAEHVSVDHITLEMLQECTLLSYLIPPSYYISHFDTEAQAFTSNLVMPFLTV